MDSHKAALLLDLLQSGKEGINHIENCIHKAEMSLSDIGVLDSLSDLLDAIESVVLKGADLPNRVRDINANIKFYIGKSKVSVMDEPDVFIYDFRYHLKSLYRLLEFEVAYIVEKFVDKKEYPRFFPESIDHDEILEKGRTALCKASVVLLSYNNLKFTRDCVESILECTNDVDYELILVDNGSTDGTKEYFDSVPGAKVIRLEYNLHVVKGFNIGLMAAEGKYSAAVCNDFIFTPQWLSNLINCIESDDKIGYVSPGATFISNLQQIDIPFISIKDFQERAGNYNRGDSRKWEDRVVLLPNVLCCPTALLEKIGYYDTRYYRGEFADDDISFRIRRAGYRLVYCGDTVVHHYGSLTTVTDHQTNSLQEGRAIFKQRYGLDAWTDARMSLIYERIDYKALSGAEKLLGIDVKCGATLMQIYNRIWYDHGIKPAIFTAATDEKYMTDLETISGRTFLVDGITHLPARLDEKADLIYIEKPLDLYSENLNELFESLSKMMSQKGKLVFTVNNGGSLENLIQMANASSSIHNRKIYLEEAVCGEAGSHGFLCDFVTSIVPARTQEANSAIDRLAEVFSLEGREKAEHLKNRIKASGWLFQFSLG